MRELNRVGVIVLAIGVLLTGVVRAAPTNECVILLHGLARTERSMKPMRKALKREGYRVHVLGYPSTEKPVAQLAGEHLAPAVAACQRERPEKLHFVSHSMGGILIRQYFSDHAVPANMGRIVMLGPPNQGSEVVDKLGHLRVYDWINGPAGQELGTGTNSLPRKLPVPAADIGIIAGTKSINLILSQLIPGADDGKVAVTNAMLPGARDFVAVPVSHTFLMRDKDVMEMTVRFLQTGAFGEALQAE